MNIERHKKAAVTPASETAALEKIVYKQSVVHKDWPVQAGDTFIEDWQRIAERLVSAIWNDPQAGRRVAIEVGLGPEHFPTSELWMLTRIIFACAEKRIRITTFKRVHNRIQPSTRTICEALNRVDEPIDERCITAILNFESSGAGLKNYATILVNNYRRVALAAILGQAYDTLMDRFSDPEEIAGEAATNITQWMSDDTFLPKPPKLARPPVIVVRQRQPAHRPRPAHKRKMRKRGAA